MDSLLLQTLLVTTNYKQYLQQSMQSSSQIKGHEEMYETESWTQQQTSILKLALQKFGIGKWQKISELKCPLYKNASQIESHAIKLLGDVRVHLYQGLHLDLDRLRADNMKDPKFNQWRGAIIDYEEMSEEQITKFRTIIQTKYGLNKETIDEIRLPRDISYTIQQIQGSNLTLIEKIQKLTSLRDAVLNAFEIAKQNQIKNKQQPQIGLKLTKQELVQQKLGQSLKQKQQQKEEEQALIKQDKEQKLQIEKEQENEQKSKQQMLQTKQGEKNREEVRKKDQEQ